MQRAFTGFGIAAVFLIFAALSMWLQSGLAATTKAKGPTHLHCPECALEMAFRRELENKPCPQCGPSGPKLVATVGPSTGPDAAGGIGLAGRLFTASVISSVLTMGLVYGWIVVTSARRRAQEEDANVPLVCHCPFCARKIGYPARKIGVGTVCARCKTAFTLPAVSELETN